ncbi:STAS domain-containing protein [Streptomyces sp. H39-C1]|uniref:STAS domain-containing protein n=1 Tax=Streptomyces sp. H39-C1 TaxID=3004355 RepID=UPI0022AE761A|nr:STAS domain-containing protein [Streptomyces sp. H39-C1]MCZ4103690.1 STAS domain-containing protein [Streptomyces sp. H39-C1]
MRRHDRESWSVITLRGEIDWDTAPSARSVIETCLQGNRDVDLDLAAVTFCDVSGLNLFLGAIQYARAAGRGIRLSRATPAVSRLFVLTGTSHLLRGPPAPSTGGAAQCSCSEGAVVIASASCHARHPAPGRPLAHPGSPALPSTAAGHR